MLGVARGVAIQFRQPVFLVRLGPPRDLAAWVAMLVPETSVNENHLAPSRKHEIGFAGQVAAMQTEPVAHRMQETAHGHFGLHAFRPDAGHDFATAFGSNGIGHHPAVTKGSGASLLPATEVRTEASAFGRFVLPPFALRTFNGPGGPLRLCWIPKAVIHYAALPEPVHPLPINVGLSFRMQNASSILIFIPNVLEFHTEGDYML